jgi:ATP-dependent Clp protease adaptor protein ClpS
MKEKTLNTEGKQKDTGSTSSLILYNDDINTFDHVIKSLVEVCGHDYIQAEQCALIVHLKGSYEVKKGSKEILTAMSMTLNVKGLKSEVSCL